MDCWGSKTCTACWVGVLVCALEKAILHMLRLHEYAATQQSICTHRTLLLFKVRAFYLASGDEVRGFGPNVRLYLQPLSSTAAAAAAVGGGGSGGSNGSASPRQQAEAHHPISEATQTIFSQSPGGRIGAGWALVVDGTVLLASEEVKPCFAVEFARRQEGVKGKGEGAAQQRVDYFRCGECNLNWLCAACATHCHSRCRDVKPFILDHLPTWACCYCSKKRSRLGCKLDGTGGTNAERAKT